MKIKKSNIANLNSIDSDGFIETLDEKKYYLKKKRKNKLQTSGYLDPYTADSIYKAAQAANMGESVFNSAISLGDTTNQEPNFLDKVKSTLNNDYTPAVIGQGLESLINLGILSKGVDKEQNRFNPYEQDVRRLTDQDIDLTQAANNIRSQFNVGLDTTKNVRSANVRNALVQNLTNTSQNSLANQALQAQQMNIGLDTQQAQVLNNLGQQIVQNQVYTDDIRARNKAVYDNELSKFAVDLADSGKGLTAYRVNESANRMMFDILNKKYADFGVSSTSFDNFMKGNYDAIDSEDLIILKRLEQQAIKQFDNGK